MARFLPSYKYSANEVLMTAEAMCCDLLLLTHTVTSVWSLGEEHIRWEGAHLQHEKERQ